MNLSEEMYFDGLLKVRLTSGTEIKSDSYLVTETYRYVLLGRPNAQTNERHLSELPDVMRKHFGDWPVLVIEPEIRTLPDGTELLPRTEIAGLFTSLDPVDPTHECLCSRLVLVWHQREPYPVISEHNAAKIARVDWNAVAKDSDLL